LKGGKARRSGAAGMEALEHAAEEAEDLLSGPAGPRTRRRPSSGKMYMWWAIGRPGGRLDQKGNWVLGPRRRLVVALWLWSVLVNSYEHFF
jgi:hypothetical protein